MSENEQLFRVVFDGSLTGEYDEATAKKRFGRLFHLNDQRVNSLFSGKNYVIKNIWEGIGDLQRIAFDLETATGTRQRTRSART